ncbi:MAG: glycosyltransferase family 2 protein [Sphingobacteriales bacterium]|nr:MAG: glycosyltransferase family 2 protein [Sphingobacteriales bacterium]
MPSVTLQISLAPTDFRHAQYLLEHQTRIFEGQVDEILLTYDTHKSKGRFAINWDENNEKMWAFLQNFALSNPKIKLIKIDYSKEKNKEIALKYFGLNFIPAKDWRGGPFYTYFFGLNEAKYDYVFHIDSDMFFGGKSQTWMQEAIDIFESQKNVFIINPLPGPPREDQTLIGQTGFKKINNKPYHFEFEGMSTRLFLTNRKLLLEKKISNIFTLKWKEFAKAIFRKNPPYRLPEEILSDYMVKNNYKRIDFLGNNEGLWSLHPPYRTQMFYEDLLNIISRIEKGDVPESQKGFYDIVDDLVDWTEARNKLLK